MRLLIVLIGVTVLASCTRKEVLESYDDGTVKVECEMDNGKRNGECIQYYPNREIEFVANYENDTLDGKAVFYHSNGELNWEVNFVHGEKNGIITYYDSLGRKFQVSTFVHSVLDGKSYSYYKNGDLSSKMTYKNGELDGVYESYYTNGKTKTKAIYENGNRLDYAAYDSLGNKTDQLIKYDISHQFDGDSTRIFIQLVDPLYAVAGLRVLDYDYELDSIKGTLDEVYSETPELDYALKTTRDRNELIFKGTLFELDTLEGGKGVVKSIRNIEYKINLNRSN